MTVGRNAKGTDNDPPTGMVVLRGNRWFKKSNCLRASWTVTMTDTACEKGFRNTTLSETGQCTGVDTTLADIGAGSTPIPCS